MFQFHNTVKLNDSIAGTGVNIHFKPKNSQKYSTSAVSELISVHPTPSITPHKANLECLNLTRQLINRHVKSSIEWSERIRCLIFLWNISGH